MIARPDASRGRSSNLPPKPTFILARSVSSYSCGSAAGPPPYSESRSNDGVRWFVVASGSAVWPRAEDASKVMSWSRNWPRNVVPAVCVGLSRLFGLSDGSVMSLTGPAARLSFASRMPPGAPNISSALRILSVAGQNAGSEPNMRPKRCGDRVTAAMPCEPTPATSVATSPAAPASPTPRMNRRRLTG